MGNGGRYAEEVAPEQVRRIQETYEGADIPLSNIYFMTIDDFDVLAEAVSGGNTTLGQSLRSAALSDEDVQTKKFSLGYPVLPSQKNALAFF